MKGLKPCPFCGGEAEWNHIAGQNRQYIKVQCTMCGAGTRVFTEYDKYGNYYQECDESARRAWNSRNGNLHIDAEAEGWEER